MKNRKVIYHIGETVGLETIAKKGELITDSEVVYIQTGDGKITFDGLISVKLIKINMLGTMVKAVTPTQTVFFSVPRIFINIGTGFEIINLFATRKAKKILQTFLEQIK
jgi:hypothetical protein